MKKSQNYLLFVLVCVLCVVNSICAFTQESLKEKSSVASSVSDIITVDSTNKAIWGNARIFNINNYPNGDLGLNIAQARKFNPENYPNGFCRVDISDIAENYWPLYFRLSKPDINGNAAIGWADDGNLYPTVIMSPDVVKKYPKLWDIYKDKIIKNKNL